MSGGSSLKDTSWAISVRVLTFNVPIMLMSYDYGDDFDICF